MKLPNLRYEKEIWNKGFNCICGIDEVGRGAWAGPVVAAAVILPKDFRSRIWSAPLSNVAGTFDVPPAGQDPGSSRLEIRDSKQLLPHQREKLDKLIRKTCTSYAISEISVSTINREGIVKATQRAFRKCLRKIKPRPDFVLIDAFYIRNLAKKNQKPIIKGDQKSVSIAAASIIAKVYRDKLMVELQEKDGRYRFDLHKGYGTKIHQEALRKHGLSKHHRLAFVPANLSLEKTRLPKANQDNAQNG